MTKKLTSLIQAVQNQIKTWLLKPTRPWPNNIWIYGLEGSVYIRWNYALDKIDLANFVIKKKYRGKGIAREIIRIRHKLNEEYAKRTGQPLEKIERDMNRDYYMSSQESLEYGLIDRVLDSPQ